MLPALILGAVLISGCVSTPDKPETRLWSCRAEVYRLAAENGMLFAQTSGGVFALVNGQLTPRGALPPHAPNEDVIGKGDGAFLSATTRFEGKLIASYWGGKSVLASLDGDLEPLFQRPPAEGDYALLALGDTLYAGTNRGLFCRRGNEWQQIDLGGELPFVRVHGIAKLGQNYVIGGIDGVAIGAPADWKTISREPVRQMLQVGKDAWILYGSGAVDKLSSDGKLVSDVLFGAAKRPWTSVLGRAAYGLLFGGIGGWIVKGGVFLESYPAEIAGEVVTAIAQHGNSLYIGTQGKGIARVTGNRVDWINPGNGLEDTWVTALLPDRGKLYAATATAGVYELRRGAAVRVPGPTEKVRHIAFHQGELIVGALDGAWRRSNSRWEKLKTTSKETTFLAVIDGSLWVGTPNGIYIDP